MKVEYTKNCIFITYIVSLNTEKVNRYLTIFWKMRQCARYYERKRKNGPGGHLAPGPF
ncbi:hypothetical protein KL86CLO1_13152 [uncultured Eubacteriales bacterium]|uniref:Uncharacterized protein n=1 Tax=uncultured Eubacteriales bacterium TaxID=172733 RepID=A0A212KHF5_9FIRM|nr:hypothetical protein KL86CLO1_13152 [uncultured Eubacteriales bacterium]